MRTSGVLMHISSLPSPYGIGTMGKEARRFADFLEKSRVRNIGRFFRYARRVMGIPRTSRFPALRVIRTLLIWSTCVRKNFSQKRNVSRIRGARTRRKWITGSCMIPVQIIKACI